MISGVARGLREAIQRDHASGHRSDSNSKPSERNLLMKTSLGNSLLPTVMVLSAAWCPLVGAQTVDNSAREVAVDPSTGGASVDTSANEVEVDPSADVIEVDTSTGEVNNSSSSPSVAPAPQPVPVQMISKMMPAETASKAKGEIRFSLVGDMMNVTGRLDGLEPSARYQLSVPPAAAGVPPEASEAATGPETSQNDGVQRNDKDPATGAPAAGPPEAGSPGAEAPAAGKPAAGKPDGTIRPGAPGAGEGTSVTGTTPPPAPAPTGGAKPGVVSGSNNISGLLGIVTADSTGGANVTLTVRSLSLTIGKEGLQGRSVTLTTVPVEGETMPVMVASGALEVAPK